MSVCTILRSDAPRQMNMLWRKGKKYYNIDQSSRDLPKGELQVGVSDLDQYLRSLMLLGSELDFFPP
jgi:hypothetical protein